MHFLPASFELFDRFYPKYGFLILLWYFKEYRDVLNRHCKRINSKNHLKLFNRHRRTMFNRMHILSYLTRMVICLNMFYCKKINKSSLRLTRFLPYIINQFTTVVNWITYKYTIYGREIAIRCNMYTPYQGKMSDIPVGGCFYSYLT